MNTTEYLQTWSDSYKNDMISNIMPFWMKYGWDRKNGGVYTCVDRDGQLMDTTKSVWFQGRFAFTFPSFCACPMHIPSLKTQGRGL